MMKYGLGYPSQMSYKAISEEKPIELWSHPVFGDVTWQTKKVAHLMTIIRLDEFYWEIKNSMRYLGIEDDMIEELIRFQKTMLKLPFKNHFASEFEYDWDSYFNNIRPYSCRRLLLPWWIWKII